MSTSVAYDLLGYLSVQISGGQLDLSNKYVGDVPIPKLSALTAGERNELIGLGTKILKDQTFDDWDKADGIVSSILTR
jgi:hypothetical protein